MLMFCSRGCLLQPTLWACLALKIDSATQHMALQLLN